MNTKDPARIVYDMLACQYKPLEARIKKAIMARPEGPAAWKKYQALPAAKKIAILDNIAAGLRL